MKALELRQEHPLTYAALLELVRDSGCRLDNNYEFPEEVQFKRIEHTLRRIKALTPNELEPELKTLELYDCQDLLAHFICGDGDVQEAVRDYMGDDGKYVFQFLNDCFDGKYSEIMFMTSGYIVYDGPASDVDDAITAWKKFNED